MKLLVVGGCGFIGSHFLKHIHKVNPDWELVVLDALTYAGDLKNIEDVPCQFIHGDIRDTASVSKAFMCKPEVVVNFAAETHVDKSIYHLDTFVSTNINGTYNLLEFSRLNKVRRFVYISSDEVYGDTKKLGRASVEDDPMRPTNCYSATKASAEHLVNAYHLTYGLDIVITRGCNTYGPNQYPEKVIPLYITNALQGKPLPVYGSGEAIREYMYVEEHASGIECVMSMGISGEAYNLSSGFSMNTIELANRIIRETNSESVVAFVEDRVGHDMLYKIDSSKALWDIGWYPKITFDKGIKNTIEYYREVKDANVRV